MLNKHRTLRPILYGANGKPLVENKAVAFPHMGRDGRMWQSRIMLWSEWTEPYGYLPADMGAQALMSYCIAVSHVYESVKENKTLVGEPSRLVPAKTLLLTYCEMYNVEPEHAVRFWPEIEKQRVLLGLSADADLPNFLKYPDRDNYGTA